MARDSLRSKQIPDLWYQVRKRVGDIRPTLPREIVGPFFNDEFGDTYGNIYALTGKGFDYAVMRDHADRIQLELQRVPDVGKIDLVGLQDEKVWIELSNTRLATLGVSMQQVQQALADQNAITGTSFFETATDRVQLRVTGQFNDIEAIRQFPIRAGDRELIVSGTDVLTAEDISRVAGANFSCCVLRLSSTLASSRFFKCRRSITNSLAD